MSYTGSKYAGSGAAKSISSTSYGNTAKSTTGVGAGAYGQPKVLAQAKPMASYAGGAPASAVKKSDEMQSFQGGLGSRERQATGLSLGGSSGKKALYGLEA